ncbi:hypothetical protein MSG28_009990 [Choristoneura fumiferana]|uniref:Uncharacterized protein n=1 Tax=Choristoneura fumiferana TaxID=7141 RepID=A0ACC0JDC4_CHOFU|nr:hypothetical protein MSG28_009990 [Choristoneura fumiferana]
MSKSNPLVGLIGYGDSDESDDEASTKPVRQMQPPHNLGAVTQEPNAAVHPAPIPHCAWSACYDEGSGFTYYWNQHTNAVTWEAPQEYLMALKLAQHQLNASGSAEVSAEEWQLYQQALADKQKPAGKTKNRPVKPPEKPGLKNGAKRKVNSDDENEKIELIDSYHNSDSESNDEESPVKTVKPVVAKPIAPKNPHKKQKTKPPVEYGPSLPANQNYTVPIGPELPPGMMVETEPKLPEVVAKEEKVKLSTKIENEDSQDESALFRRLKDKAKLLEKLGGEIPSELQKMIQEEPKNSSPKIVDESSRDSSKLDIDDLLSEIEQKELPKIKSKKIDMFGEEQSNSGKNTPTGTPPREFKPLFPSSKAIEEAPLPPLPPANIENGLDKTVSTEAEKKPINVYLADSEVKENRKKLRIDNSVLPDRKKSEVPAYTTKYSQFIEGFSSERTGLGFKEDKESDSPKATSTINYGNGLTFTKGEVLNEDKKDEDLDEMSELVEAKLKFFNEVQPCPVGPVQEMLIQFQAAFPPEMCEDVLRGICFSLTNRNASFTSPRSAQLFPPEMCCARITLVTAFRSGALTASYWRRWVTAGELSLLGLERRAAPPGWTCAFQRYVRPTNVTPATSVC